MQVGQQGGQIVVIDIGNDFVVVQVELVVFIYLGGIEMFYCGLGMQDEGGYKGFCVWLGLKDMWYLFQIYIYLLWFVLEILVVCFVVGIVVVDEGQQGRVVDGVFWQFQLLCLFVVYVLLVVCIQLQLVEVVWYVGLVGYCLVDDFIYGLALCVL